MQDKEKDLTPAEIDPAISAAESQLDDLETAVQMTGHAIDVKFVTRVVALGSDDVLATYDGPVEFSKGFVDYLGQKASVAFQLRCDGGAACQLEHIVPGWHVICILYHGVKFVDKKLAFDSFMKELINRATIVRM